MVVVLKRFSQKKQVPEESVFRMIPCSVVAISILVTTPVDEGSMNGAHQEVDWQKGAPPNGWSEGDVDQGVKSSEAYPYQEAISQSIYKRPGIQVLDMCRGALPASQSKVHIDAEGIEHHVVEILEEMGRVRIVLCVAMHMMLHVKLGVRFRMEKRGSLS